MNAHGVVLPTTKHRMPLGQYTSDEFSDCFLMLSREHVKQNLCEVCEGHCTNRVSSRVLWHNRQCMGTSLAPCAGLGEPFLLPWDFGLCGGEVEPVGLCAAAGLCKGLRA